MDRHKTPYKILNILKDGQFHSGEELGASLSITRSAIWKAIKQLSEIGIPIQSTTGRGYCIAGGLQLLNQVSVDDFIDPSLRSETHLAVYDQVESTNDILLKSNNTHQFEVALAEQQTKGRGRHHRHWISPYGQNIYCSIRWNSDKDPSELSGLSLATAVAIAQSLAEYGIDPALIGLKWPNDVLIDHQKIAGTLIELNAESHSKTNTIIGIGINTHLSEYDASQIDQPWTSLHNYLQAPINRSQLAGILISKIIKMLKEFSVHNLAQLLTVWKKHDIYANQAVKLTNGTSIIEGTYQGITPRGELILVDASDTTHHVISGEMSLCRC